VAESLVRVFDRAEDWAVPRISPSQVKVLGFLRYRGQMNLSALAEEIGAIPSSASRLCDRLEAAGLIGREVPPDNRRAVRLSLTKEGRRRLESFDAARRGDFTSVLERMSPQARGALLEGLLAFDIAAQELRDVSA
jgi:DNA-binding MarR family transcriptional regulator